MTAALAVWLLCATVPRLQQHLRRWYPAYAALLLVCGTLLDEYRHLLGAAALDRVGQLVDVLGSSRHVLLFGIPLLLVGRLINEHQEALLRLRPRTHLLLGAAAAAAGLVECILLYQALGRGSRAT